MLKMREALSLVGALIVIAMGIYVTIYEGVGGAWMFYGVGIALVILYLLRRKMRLKMMEEQEKNS